MPSWYDDGHTLIDIELLTVLLIAVESGKSKDESVWTSCGKLSMVTNGNRPKKCKKRVLLRGLDPPGVEPTVRYRLVRTVEGLLKLATGRQQQQG